METKMFNNYGVNAATYSDYMLLIAPPDEVIEMVRKYKLSSARMIGNFDSMHSKAHISVTGQYRQMPVTMRQKLDNYQRFVGRLKSIELRIAGFAYFSHGRSGFTIYAKIELNTEVNKWFAHLKRIFGDRQGITPHITIAKNIPPHAFKMLWPEFAMREYAETFTPDKLTVLCRPTININDDNWVHFKELHFSK
ncbi:2'-5' RNA ligase family protein [Mucilaginibacter sp. HMF5004]|uniref:2'-5' RNA ligase family protein n=1 Tax=Mucilaginibacter rivuli TaxID=2857527 RepID=UPI001C5D66DB|nr:2'-5' RNA ligase family protein [Mucilaginibacter rivuli]MBW4891392.1 2'-5' RNA ligase family protein [Mucilaginibacter rivuli]